MNAREVITIDRSRQSIENGPLMTSRHLIRQCAQAREKNFGISIGPQADHATNRRGGRHESLHRLPGRVLRPPHEPEKLWQVGQQFRTVVRQVRPRSTSAQHRSEEHTPESKRRRAIDPYYRVSAGQPVLPCRRVPAFEDPTLTGLDLMAKTRLLVTAALDPPWLPVNRVDMHDRQARALAKLTRQGTFPRPWLTNDHHPLH